MGLRRLHIVAAASLALCAVACATPGAAQSLTDRFRSLFEKSDKPPIVNNEQPPPEVVCPPVSIRAGASTYAVATPGKEAIGNDVKYQASIGKTARECIKNGDEVIVHLGIQGRVIVGPAGAPANVEIPMRVAVVEGGIGEKMIATKAYRTNVEVGEQDNVPFTLVVDDVVYPAPPAATADNYILYVGFDPQALAPAPKQRTAKKKR